jgi:hypothetical protein
MKRHSTKATDDKRASTGRARVQAGKRIQTLSGKVGMISSLMLDSLKDYGEFYKNTLHDVGDRLLEGGGLSPGELLADATAMSIEGVAATTEFLKSAVGICTSAPGGTTAYGEGVVVFSIDKNSETTSPLALGNVHADEFDLLEESDLKRDGGAEFIPQKHVKLMTFESDVWVCLADLGAVMPNLKTGLYRGAINRKSNAGQGATRVSNLLVLLL